MPIVICVRCYINTIYIYVNTIYPNMLLDVHSTFQGTAPPPKKTTSIGWANRVNMASKVLCIPPGFDSKGPERKPKESNTVCVIAYMSVKYKAYLSTISFFKGGTIIFRMWILLIPFSNPIGSKLPIPSPKKYNIKIKKTTPIS